MRQKPATPLSTEDFIRAAATYLTRRAASTAQLRAYLLRRAARASRSDGGADEAVTEPQDHIRDRIAEALVRIAGAGLLDDAALARTRASAFVHKGLPARRRDRLLAAQGLDPNGPGLEAISAVDDEAQALRFAERKRLGRFASGRRAPSFERDVRALIRAGFSPAVALRTMRQLMPDASTADVASAEDTEALSSLHRSPGEAGEGR